MFEETDMTGFGQPEVHPEGIPEPFPNEDLTAFQPLPEARSKSAAEMADEYNVSDKSVQQWFKAVTTAYCWIDIQDLRTGSGRKTRYTPLCQDLIAKYRAESSSMTESDWIASVHAANPEKVAATATQPQDDIPLSRTEVLPPYRPALPPSDRPAVLPPVDRTAAPSHLPTGSSYLNALEEEELELEQLEAQELELLERMSNNLQRLDQNHAQWQRTNDLRRQRLLRQARLEAAALATELEAEFEETLRESQYNIRRGNVGKPPAEEQESQSA
jgi:hypothetical protein